MDSDAIFLPPSLQEKSSSENFKSSQNALLGARRLADSVLRELRTLRLTKNRFSNSEISLLSSSNEENYLPSKNAVSTLSFKLIFLKIIKIFYAVKVQLRRVICTYKVLIKRKDIDSIQTILRPVAKGLMDLNVDYPLTIVHIPLR